MAAVLPIVSLVGAGLSAYSSFSQAKTQQRIAQFNYQMELNNAKLQSMSQMAALQQQQAASQIAMKQAEINFAMAQAEANARQQNASRIRQAAEARSESSREEIRRKRLDFARFQATQRARIAGSGVVEAGSPLELLAETAGNMQLAIEDLHYQANLDRTQALNEAEMESFGARLMKAGAASNLSLEKVASKVREGGFTIDAFRIASQERAARTQAGISRMVAFSDAKGQKLAAGGTLLSGFGNFATARNTYNYVGIK